MNIIQRSHLATDVVAPARKTYNWSLVPIDEPFMIEHDTIPGDTDAHAIVREKDIKVVLSAVRAYAKTVGAHVESHSPAPYTETIVMVVSGARPEWTGSFREWLTLLSSETTIHAHLAKKMLRAKSLSRFENPEMMLAAASRSKDFNLRQIKVIDAMVKAYRG